MILVKGTCGEYFNENAENTQNNPQYSLILSPTIWDVIVQPQDCYSGI